MDVARMVTRKNIMSGKPFNMQLIALSYTLESICNFRQSQTNFELRLAMIVFILSKPIGLILPTKPLQA